MIPKFGGRFPRYAASCIEVPHRFTGGFGVCKDVDQNGVPSPNGAVTPRASAEICLFEVSS